MLFIHFLHITTALQKIAKRHKKSLCQSTNEFSSVAKSLLMSLIWLNCLNNLKDEVSSTRSNSCREKKPFPTTTSGQALAGRNYQQQSKSIETKSLKRKVSFNHRIVCAEYKVRIHFHFPPELLSCWSSSTPTRLSENYINVLPSFRLITSSQFECGLIEIIFGENKKSRPASIWKLL